MQAYSSYDCRLFMNRQHQAWPTTRKPLTRARSWRRMLSYSLPRLVMRVMGVDILSGVVRKDVSCDGLALKKMWVRWKNESGEKPVFFETSD